MALIAAAKLTAEPPPNDDFGDRAELSGPAGRLQATSADATIQAGEPNHGSKESGASVWWRWVAPEDGVAAFRTHGSSFDTLLGVYTGTQIDGLDVIAIDDDSGAGQSSVAIFHADAGSEYQIAVAGEAGASGALSLAWDHDPDCVQPSSAAGPSPPDGAVGVVRTPRLEWAQLERRIRRVVYGEDDRREIFEVEDPRLRRAADATVAVVSRHKLEDNGDGTFHLTGPPFGEFYNLCPEERFFDQPTPPAWCTGFLVAADLVVTAGHCIRDVEDCASVAFVFGFRMLDPATPIDTVPAAQVYFCSEIVARQDNAVRDWGVIRLDRSVPDHRPLRIRRTGKVPDQQPVVVIGHPGGVPAKLAGGARVRENAFESFFEANLDTYAGNSGSPVINADTLVVEGVLVSGEEDFVEAGECRVTKRCGDDDCLGETATRTTEFDHLVPAHPDTIVYEVYLGPCGELEPAVETMDTVWTPPILDPQTTYCWQVIARDACGSTTGPIWSFTTSTATHAAFRRADVVGGGPLDDPPEGTVDLSDAVLLLRHLFLGAPLAHDCDRAADVDDSGELDLTDPVYLLAHLFLGGPPPPAPFPGCGSDATADGLTCRSFPACSGE